MIKQEYHKRRALLNIFLSKTKQVEKINQEIENALTQANSFNFKLKKVNIKSTKLNLINVFIESHHENHKFNYFFMLTNYTYYPKYIKNNFYTFDIINLIIIYINAEVKLQYEA